MKDTNISLRFINGKNNQLLLTETDYLGPIDLIACKALKLECPSYIIPFTISSPDSGTESIQIAYEVEEDMIILRDYQGMFKIEEILNFYKQTIDYLEDCGNFFLNKTNFSFEPSNVFLNPKKATIHFIYVPVKNSISYMTDLKQLFIELLEKCAADSGENIQIQLYRYFNKSRFSFEEFKIQLNTIQTKSSPIVESPLTSPIPSENARTERNNYVQDTIDKLVELEASKLLNLSDNTSESAHSSESPEPIHAGNISSSKILAENSSLDTETSKIVSQYFKTTFDSKKKNLFGNIFSVVKENKTETVSPVSKHGMCLKRSNDKSKYNLPKLIPIVFENDIFSLGRQDEHSNSKESSFEFSHEVNPISRQHASIEQLEGSCYLIDKESKNGTFLNGKRIEPHKPYKLFEDDVIAFGIAFSDNSISYVFIED